MSEMRWLRLWTDITDDDKLVTLAFEDRWHYVAILCFKRRNILDSGCAPELLDKRLGALLGLGNVERDALRERLIEAQLIDRQWQPIGWKNRQFESDSSNGRVKKYRRRRVSNGLPKQWDGAKFWSKLLRRDGKKICVYCCASTNLCVDHMVPIALGGTDDIDNLAIACKACNSGKQGRTPEQAKMTFAISSAEKAHRRYLSCNGD